MPYIAGITAIRAAFDGRAGVAHPVPIQPSQGKQFMGEMIGWLAYILDSEGNRIGIQEPGPPPA